MTTTTTKKKKEEKEEKEGIPNALNPNRYLSAIRKQLYIKRAILKQAWGKKKMNAKSKSAHVQTLKLDSEPKISRQREWYQPDDAWPRHVIRYGSMGTR